MTKTTKSLAASLLNLLPETSKSQKPIIESMLSTVVRKAAGLTSLMLLSAVSAAAQSYQFTSFGEIFAELESPLPTVALLPTCISDNGVLGFTQFFGPSSYLIDRTEWESFSPSGINAVNASGATVGSAITGGWLRLPDGTTTTLALPTGTRVTPRSISANGTIVGSFLRGATHGFILDDNGYTQVDYPGAISTLLRGVNANGTMVGTCILPGPQTRAFLLERDGRFSLLDIPGSTRSEALGINNRGQIVGSFRTATSPTFGFVSNRGQITVVDMTSELPPSIVAASNGVPRTYTLVPGSVGTTVVAINTRGEILVSSTSSYRTPSAPISSVTAIWGFVGTASQGK